MKWRFTKTRQGVRGHYLKVNHWPGWVGCVCVGGGGGEQSLETPGTTGCGGDPGTEAWCSSLGRGSGLFATECKADGQPGGSPPPHPPTAQPVHLAPSGLGMGNGEPVGHLPELALRERPKPPRPPTVGCRRSRLVVRAAGWEAPPRPPKVLREMDMTLLGGRSSSICERPHFCSLWMGGGGAGRGGAGVLGGAPQGPWLDHVGKVCSLREARGKLGRARNEPGGGWLPAGCPQVILARTTTWKTRTSSHGIPPRCSPLPHNGSGAVRAYSQSARGGGRGLRAAGGATLDWLPDRKQGL